MTHKLMILHLSDIHIASSSNSVLGRAEAIAKATFQRLPEVELLAIVISGDIAATGKESEYDLAYEFLQKVQESITRESPSVAVRLFVCPGNHDCDFAKNNDTREAVLARIRSQDSTPPSGSLIETAVSVQAAFFAFLERLPRIDWSHETKLSWQTEFAVAGKKVGMRCLNLAWMSDIKERQGTLVFPPSAVVPFDTEPDVTISVLHHPFNWLGQTTYRPFQTALRRHSHLILTGHEHFQNVVETSDLQSSPTVTVEGGVLFEPGSPSHSTLNVVMIDLDSKQYLMELYSWNGIKYLAEIDDTEEWGSLRPLPTKGGQEFHLRKEFISELNDPGANFSHSAKKTLALDDIFVWPELRLLDDPAPIKKQVSGAFLEDIDNLNLGVFLRGDEKAGKSTLLRRYFLSYYNRGYMPLYLRANWLTKVHQTDPLRAIKYALDRQYVRQDHAAWLQDSREKRVLLLDDVDAATLPPEALSRCLTALFPYFAGLIVTVTDEAAAMDLLSIDRVGALNKFTNYEVREFGHKKRFELVCKWAEIGGIQEGTSQKWMETIDRWEKDLTTAVGQQFVPSVPMFLLTLLQSIESGRTADLQNSAFGHYYQFLVTSAFQNVGIEREQWSEVMNYCANFAWFIHSSGRHSTTPKEFEAFNEAFSREFTPVQFGKRRRDLVKASLISEIDDEVEFKYPYLFYYFLGQYFADRIHDPAIEQAIGALCDDLYLRDNANILLFTSHHTKSPIIYERISKALSKCFEDEPSFDFSTDTHLLNQLVDSAPQLIYHDSGGSTTLRRAEVREDEDRVHDEVDPDLDTAEVAGAMTRLFRGMEILGQFLKNHYGTTKNPIKEQLIKELIESSLRGLRGTSKYLVQDSGPLIDFFENAISEHLPDLTLDERKAQARRIIFDLIGMLTFAFLQKAGSAVGSPYLKDNLQAVVGENSSLAYALIEMSYQFDLPQKVPFTKLKELNKRVEKNVFCRALLQTMALRHLHLFKVDYKDKQRLCEELDITIRSGKAARPHRPDGPEWLPAT
jgi:hypothetical protein